MWLTTHKGCLANISESNKANNSTNFSIQWYLHFCLFTCFKDKRSISSAKHARRLESSPHHLASRWECPILMVPFAHWLPCSLSSCCKHCVSKVLRTWPHPFTWSSNNTLLICLTISEGLFSILALLFLIGGNQNWTENSGVCPTTATPWGLDDVFH